MPIPLGKQENMRYITPFMVYAQYLGPAQVVQNQTISGGLLNPPVGGNWINASGTTVAQNTFCLWIKA